MLFLQFAVKRNLSEHQKLLRFSGRKKQSLLMILTYDFNSTEVILLLENDQRQQVVLNTDEIEMKLQDNWIADIVYTIEVTPTEGAYAE